MLRRQTQKKSERQIEDPGGRGQLDAPEVRR